jgi:valyl-tRNA synthetase
MSKTLGNVIDPLDIMQVFGTDALRFTLLVGSTPGKDMNLSLEKVEANRNFANKLWNAGRFILGAIEHAPAAAAAPPQYTTADAWIWARQKQLRQTVAHLFATHQYGEAGRQIYDFFWSEFADWYLEIAKLQMAEGNSDPARRDTAFYTADVLVSVFDTCLRLLHPYTPFVTEELWSRLRDAAGAVSPKIGLQDVQDGNWPPALIVAPWPQPMPEDGWEARAIADFSRLQEILRAIRNQRAERNVKPALRIPATLVTGEALLDQITADAGIIASLAGLDTTRLTILASLPEKPAGSISLVAGNIEIYLPLSGMVDVAEERARLERDLAGVQGQIARLENLLASPFAQKAPPNVVEGERAKLAGCRDDAAKIQSQLAGLA